SWPPREARSEVLYLAKTSLSTTASTADESFRSTPRSIGRGVLTEGEPSTNGYSEMFRAACAERNLPGEIAAGRVFFTKPLRKPAVIAGNPFAYLKLTTDQPGGQVSVQLVDVSPDAECGPLPPSSGSARPLSVGTADLRFIHGNYSAEPFPVGTPTRVRIDLTHLAERIAAGHRLAVVVSWGDLIDRFSLPYAPHVIVDGASEIVLPLLKGTLGGKAPRHDYPPRPFLPKT
ncbi:MAG: CocE/NonD family hydrolase C-terminal non-catalytic domain-containing protein, partial [Actinomycetota bacterium]